MVAGPWLELLMRTSILMCKTQALWGGVSNLWHLCEIAYQTHLKVFVHTVKPP